MSSRGLPSQGSKADLQAQLLAYVCASGDDCSKHLPTAAMLYFASRIDKVRLREEKGSKASIADISQYMAAKWSSMSSARKRKYVELEKRDM